MSREQDTRRVSDSYRDIATETSPANLDDRVMAIARLEARTRYGLARAWIRPVAWAATIGLSFAFLLEMTYFEDTAQSVDQAIPPSVDDDAGPADNAAGPDSQAPAFKRAPATVVAAPEMKASDMPALREAEERADATAASFAADATDAEARRERASPGPAASADSCAAEDRQSADAWYRCVLALREQGLEDAAAAEFAALREAFPDFREPVSE